MKTMDSWFFLRPGFASFKITPETQPGLLFGSREQKKRDYLIGEIEGACYGRAGYKAVVFGDYGRGKTHLSLNLKFKSAHDGLGVVPIYLKCSAYTAKEPFSTLFGQFLRELNLVDVRRVATEYFKMVADGKARPIREIVHLEDVAVAIEDGLQLPNDNVVRDTMRWLGGEKVTMTLVAAQLKDRLTDSREFGAVMRGLTHMYREVDGKVLLYFLDEAERLENITHIDTYAAWTAAFRELTEIEGLGLIMFIGALTRNALPTILLSDEIMRRVGVANYVEFQNPGRDDIRDFLVELLGTLVQKGPVPDVHQPAMSSEALSEEVPEGLIEATGGNEDRLRFYPFEPDAFEDFVEQIAAGDMSSKPSEALIRLTKAATTAMRKDKKTIDSKIVDDIGQEGF
ncbi:MAG: hypothetical protein HEQ22_16955 [Sphingopyxis sp.]|uniref:hypothetical protein n=1 Tax=Sphingopyxis sp. TaxID=1908224 RepID=UPI003D8104B2